MIVSAMAAYVVNKYDFAMKNVIYIVSIFIMIIPTTGSIATTYKLMNDLGLAGHRYGLIILAASGFGFNFFMIYSAFAEPYNGKGFTPRLKALTIQKIYGGKGDLNKYE